MASQKLTGTVQTGLQEGAYYMNQDGYRKPLAEKLGFTPFTGTLNLRVNKNQLKQFIAHAQAIPIPGFQTSERGFGPIQCYRVKINQEIGGALLLPDRTTHKNVAEVIARENLRKTLSLKDGDTVSLELAK